MPKRAAEEGDGGDPSKKAKLDDGTASVELEKDDEGNYYLDLGNKKRASVSVFKGKPLVNIREVTSYAEFSLAYKPILTSSNQFYADKSGELKPGKKGITLSPAQWGVLVSGAARLSEQVKAAEDGNTEEKEKPKEKEKSKAKDKVTKSKK
ncbi:hypothetical protein BU17DRAFT_70232 [Hysterangium stoloniferum]|nr:hypothetical protein BU17DRAFT_70232 [Hysterangium stoloniferum]